MRQSKRRRQQNQRETENQYGNLRLEHVEPMTPNQTKAFREFRDGKHTVLKGSAGVGKTFIALALALEAVFEKEQYSRIIILRSARSSNDIGFLPGSQSEKTSVYETAYRETVNKLFDDQTAYDKLKSKGTIRFDSTSFLRGLNFDDAIVILDEAQNASAVEISTVATRIGENSRLMILGDRAQLDYMKSEKSGFDWFCRVFSRVRNTAIVQFTAQDVVRSGFVKDFLLAVEDEYDQQHKRVAKLEAA